MLYYLMMFIIVLIITYYAELKYKKNKIKVGHIFSIIIIFLLSVFAGMRDYSVGIDVSIYVVPYFEKAQISSNLWQFIIDSNIEPLFGVIIYLNAKYAKDLFYTLFLCQLLTITPIYLCIYKKRKDISITLSVMIYLFLFYNLSFCIIRQCISIALIMYAFICCKDKRIKKISIFIISILFHYSSIIFLSIIIILKIFQNKRYSVIINIILITIAVMSIFFISDIIGFLSNDLHIIRNMYYDVFITMMENKNNDISIFETFLKGIFILFPYFLSLKRKNTELAEYTEMAYYSFFGYVLSFAAVISQYLVRLSYFFSFYMIFTLSQSAYFFKNRKNKYTEYKLTLFILLIVYWYVVYVKWNWFGTVPYVFK